MIDELPLLIATPGCHHIGNHVHKPVLPSIGARCKQAVRSVHAVGYISVGLDRIERLVDLSYKKARSN
jgi:hypothetical protein